MTTFSQGDADLVQQPPRLRRRVDHVGDFRLERHGDLMVVGDP